MSVAIQPLRRSVLSKTQILLHHLKIQYHSPKPFSSFSKFHYFQPSFQPKSRNYGSMVTGMRNEAFENKLLRLLRNDIQYELDNSPHKPPSEFNGFKVDERPGERWISLAKKYGKSEEINVEVTMVDGSIPILKEGDKSDQPEEGEHLHITMIISVYKGNSNRVLEFICSAWPDSVEIQKLFVRERSKMPNKEPYTGPIFEELDDQLQESLYDFLEDRGIDDKLCVFLHNYASYKDKAELTRWLDSARKVIEKK